MLQAINYGVLILRPDYVFITCFTYVVMLMFVVVDGLGVCDVMSIQQCKIPMRILLLRPIVKLGSTGYSVGLSTYTT